jgi:hypothetical protein
MLIGQKVHTSFKPLTKMYMFTSLKTLISQLGPFEKPRILVVLVLYEFVVVVNFVFRRLNFWLEGLEM